MAAREFAETLGVQDLSVRGVALRVLAGTACLSDIDPEEGVHVAAPQPRHEEEARDHRVDWPRFYDLASSVRRRSSTATARPTPLRWTPQYQPAPVPSPC